MKSYAIDEHKHIIETEIRFPTKNGYQDRIEVQLYKGKIEKINIPDLEVMIGATVPHLELHVCQMEIHKSLKAIERLENFIQQQEKTLAKLKAENENLRTWSEENADDIYMNYVERINYTKN